MRNYLALAAAVGLAGVAHAQSTSDITQAGANAAATVNQTGSNTSVVDQTSSGQAISAFVTQTGANSAEITQDHNRTGLRNAGTMTATVNQYSGTGSEAIIEQGPANGGLSNANGYIGELSATINQTGDSHFATQSQRRRDNTATITQTGENNDARQGQDREILDDQPGSEHTATITQGGRNSFAVQTQDGHDHMATITQAAGTDGNRAEQDQDSGFDTIGGGHEATIGQSGSFNAAYQTQAGLLNTATITQSGNSNYAKQDQSGFTGLNTATATQSGDFNSVTQTQGFLGGHVATATQSGVGEAGELNTVTQIQEGIAQESVVFQAGGEGNSVETTQTGFDHYSTVSQGNAFNTATVLQSGTTNTVAVTQN